MVVVCRFSLILHINLISTYLPIQTHIPYTPLLKLVKKKLRLIKEEGKNWDHPPNYKKYFLSLWNILEFLNFISYKYYSLIRFESVVKYLYYVHLSAENSQIVRPKHTYLIHNSSTVRELSYLFVKGHNLFEKVYNIPGPICPNALLNSNS